jgi:hypothetical protein
VAPAPGGGGDGLDEEAHPVAASSSKPNPVVGLRSGVVRAGQPPCRPSYGGLLLGVGSGGGVKETVTGLGTGEEEPASLRHGRPALRDM